MQLMHARWTKLNKDFCSDDEQRRFDMSKVPDIYDPHRSLNVVWL